MKILTAMAPAGARSLTALSALALCLCTASPAQADTLVRFQTSLGAFDVSLYDSVAPATVANFLAYVSSQRYDNTLVHRSVPGFLIAGGGYYPDFSGVPADAPVLNEASLSHARGTLAMARTFALNSATSQWFINTADNAAILDSAQYTVFGVVLGDGMQVVDAIAALPTYDYASINVNLGTLPLRDFAGAPPTLPALQNLVTVSIAAVPEAGSAGLLAGGLVALAGLAARRRRAARAREAAARQPGSGRPSVPQGRFIIRVMHRRALPAPRR